MKAIKTAALVALALYLFDQGMASDDWRAAINLLAGVTAVLVAASDALGRREGG